MYSAFFAYSSRHPAITYTIPKAIERINQEAVDPSNGVVVTPWVSQDVIGKHIIDEVCDKIIESDLFMCDLTFPTPNVVFELGYAIINRKRIWLTVDKNLWEQDKFKGQLGFINTIGYVAYENYHELANRFLQAQPHLQSDDSIFGNFLKTKAQGIRDEPSILYVKPGVTTDQVFDLGRHLDGYQSHRVLFDDPQEVSSRPLEWYFENIHGGLGVVTHFLDDLRENKAPYNLRGAFVSGMAYGIAKPILMLAHSPYQAPVDYFDLLQVCETPDKCILHFDNWVTQNREKFQTTLNGFKKHQKKAKSEAILKRIDLGQYVAEDEQSRLSEYFIESPMFSEALSTSQYGIFVGRKGSGKTANLYRIAEYLRNMFKSPYHVCVIKPIDYQVNGIFEIYERVLPQSTTSNLVETIWKSLIYTEIARSIYFEIDSQIGLRQLSKEDMEYIEYFEDKQQLIHDGFAVRLETILEQVKGIDLSGTIKSQEVNVAQALHNRLIPDLRAQIGQVLSNSDKEKIFVLVDNLDKSWSRQSNLQMLSEFLFGLLSAADAISKDFQRSSSRVNSIDLSLIIFLRSDIFHYIIPNTRERDKFKHTYLNWNDKDLLKLVIEKRIKSSLDPKDRDIDVWREYFVGRINGSPVNDYLVGKIIPRPRDIIFLTKRALSHAINHEHDRIEADDIELAEKDYSQYAWYTLISETEATYPEIESILIEFAGSTEIVTYEQIESYITNSKVEVKDIRALIDLLCEATFLGLETRPDDFEYIYQDSKREILKTLARKVTDHIKSERFKIHVAFHPFLEITS
ncbi:MAG: hypothetical protein J0M33_14105 [Anaerolineae bacterium]|nr:hypothetical protein [Anaerolineae bacterium]